MLPWKFCNLEAWKCYFQRSPRAICDLRISRIIYFVQETNAHWEYNTCNVDWKIENPLSLYLETSKCFTFQSHHSKLQLLNCLSCLRDKRRLHRQVVLWKLPKQLLDNILFSTFYTGLFLLFRKKLGVGGHGYPGPSPCYGTVNN